ncbi:MAG: methyltransferase [Candidatus Eiseniibacteriota bacterium]|jgi:(2Fe-2S) ferredoxin/predicted O-methyltransferase YrrM
MTATPFRKHIIVCTQRKPDGLPCCAAVGGVAALEQLRAAVERAGVADEVLVTGCDCLGLCDRGPNAIVDPEGIWWTGLDATRIEQLVESLGPGARPAAGDVGPSTTELLDEVLAHRRHVAAVRAAQAAAGALPEPLNQMVRGFQASRILLTAIELDVFTQIDRLGGAAGATAAAVAGALDAAPRGVTVLLDALVGLELLARLEDGRYRNGPWADRLLRAGAPHDRRAMLQHLVHLWPRWSRLTECVRAGTAVDHDEMIERGETWTRAFIGAMHQIASLRAPQVVAALDREGVLDGVRTVLDLGGGSGAYAHALARALPELRVTVFDLPTVTPLTRQYAAEAGLADRVHTIDGDLRADSLGSDFDLVVISAICHMLGPAENTTMLERTRRALRPGGHVVIQDFIPDAMRTGPPSALLFGINMLVGTREGGVYTAAEYERWLGAAGFVEPRTIRLPGPTDLLLATRPA